MSKKRIVVVTVILCTIVTAIGLFGTTGARFSDQKSGDIKGKSGHIEITTTGCDYAFAPGTFAPGAHVQTPTDCIVKNTGTVTAGVSVNLVATADGPPLPNTDGGIFAWESSDCGEWHIGFGSRSIPVAFWLRPSEQDSCGRANFWLHDYADNSWQDRTITLKLVFSATQFNDEE